MPDTADLDLLQAIRASYDDPMTKVEEALRGLGLQPVTSRLKTPGTIIDKLQRQPTRLSQLQDIAGVRTVQEGLREQNAAVAMILLAFPGAELVDRRINPSHGYRAIHLVPTVDGCPVEIQVRTYLQDLWAQLTEKLGDLIGRGIRYGDLSTETQKALSPHLILFSDDIARRERLVLELDSAEADFQLSSPNAEVSPEEAAEYEARWEYYRQQREAVREEILDLRRRVPLLIGILASKTELGT